MRVLVISPVFPPEPIVSAQTTAQIAEDLADRGHDVTVITAFPNRPAGRLFPGYRRRLYAREQDEARFTVLRCFSTISSESRMMSRFAENISFGITGGGAALTTRRPDVIYANTWPIFATGILALVARIRRIPLVISVQDIYPGALIAQGRIRQNGVLARLMHWIDGLIARNSAHVIVISGQFAEIYRKQRQVLAERLSLIPNWIDSNRIDMNITGQEYRRSREITDEEFLMVYGGNVGVAAGVEAMIEAMRLSEGEPAIRLLIAGSGSQLAACRQLASTIPSERVLFHSPWAAEETSQVLRAADLLILPTQREQSLASAPSKLLSYMLAGHPVLATAVPGSDLADLVLRAQCGWLVEPDRPDLLVAQIAEIMKVDPSERQRRGENGRRYVLQHFSKSVCLPRVIRIIEEACQ